jgi:hypothetical protein
MTVPRYGPSATALPDGRVLVAGGYYRAAGGDLGTAEIYDPATGRWSWTARMYTSRREHLATPLRDGRVLLTGGFSGDSVLALAELFDPVRENWVPAVPMQSPRVGHTATVLQDGRVLVTGGEMPRGVSAPLLPGIPSGAYFRGPAGELYDPTTGGWLPTGGMHSRRSSHTATLLPDGTVLIAGGYDQLANSQVASCEIFDPRTLLFRPTGAMGGSRAGHSAVTMDGGGVLVAGGRRDYFGALGSAELYRPQTGTWVPMPSMLSAHTFHTALRLSDGRVLVAGGSTASGDTTGSETYAG